MLNALRIELKFLFYQPVEPQALLSGTEKGKEMGNWQVMEKAKHHHLKL